MKKILSLLLYYTFAPGTLYAGVQWTPKESIEPEDATGFSEEDSTLSDSNDPLQPWLRHMVVHSTHNIKAKVKKLMKKFRFDPLNPENFIKKSTEEHQATRKHYVPNTLKKLSLLIHQHHETDMRVDMAWIQYAYDNSSVEKIIDILQPLLKGRASWSKSTAEFILAYILLGTNPNKAYSYFSQAIEARPLLLAFQILDMIYKIPDLPHEERMIQAVTQSLSLLRQSVKNSTPPTEQEKNHFFKFLHQIKKYPAHIQHAFCESVMYMTHMVGNLYTFSMQGWSPYLATLFFLRSTGEMQATLPPEH